MTARSTPLVLAFLLSGCAAATPGFSPFGNGSKSPTAEIGHVEGGKYVMTQAERALDCRHITGSMLITIARLKDKTQSFRPSELSTGMKKTIAPIFGSQNLDPETDFEREKAKLHAYNAFLGEKGCKQLDVEAELAKPPEGPKKY